MHQNELVKARIRNEELEEELVRYKLLCVPCHKSISLILIASSYAEAMHENQDAQSSHRMSAATMQSRRGSEI